MKKKILAGLLLAGSTMFAAPRVSFGIGIGVPAPVVVAPPFMRPFLHAPAPATCWWMAYGVRRRPRLARLRRISTILTGMPNIFAANA